MMMKTYMVKAERSDGWWALEVPEVPGLFSQARRLDQAEATARDALALMLDVALDSFAIEVVPELDAETREVLDDLAHARNEAARAQRQATSCAQLAVRVLTNRDGLTMRDAGIVLGVSHQRIAQLAHGTPITVTPADERWMATMTEPEPAEDAEHQDA